MFRLNAHKHATFAKRLSVLVVLTALVGALLALGAPSASAQDEIQFESLAFEQACGADQHVFQPVVTITVPGSPAQNAAACGTTGFFPVRTKALCDQFGSGVSWIATKNVCATSYWFGHVVTQSWCLAPQVWIEDHQITPGHPAADACAIPLLSNAPRNAAWFRSVTPACIEDSIVQGDVAAAALRAGDSFVSTTNGTTYTIVVGGPTCTFGCYDGFDMNCDGTLGDYCPVEIDAKSVHGVVGCHEAVLV